MFKTEWVIFGMIVVCIFIIAVSVTMVFREWGPVFEQIDEQGLKSVIDDIWCGKDGCT